jgi:hypothetical protein
VVWKPGKLQSNKTALFNVELHLTVHKSFVSTSLKILFIVVARFISAIPIGQHRGKTSAHAPNYENMAGNLNINF